MAIYSGARYRPITPGANDPAIIPIGVILHVDAGNSGSLYDYFSSKSGGIESHFFIRKDGGVEQYRDTAVEADANYHGNSFIRGGKRYGFISVETQGLVDGDWTDQQLTEIKKLLLWAHTIHDIELRKCPAWNEAGVGYHVMWGAPGPWTPVAKVCPGPNRVRQFEKVLVPWMKTALIKPPVGDDMPFTDAQIRALVQAELEEYGKRLFGPGGSMNGLIAKVDALDDKVDKLIAALPKAP